MNRPGSIRIFVMVGLIVIAVGAVDQIAGSRFPTRVVPGQETPIPTHRTYWLNGDNYLGWNLTKPGPFLWADSGDLLTLMLKSNDGFLHQWFIDFNKNFQLDSNETSTASPLFSQTGSYTNFTFVPIIGGNIPRAGNWSYLCPYHYPFMYGTIMIKASPNSLSAAPQPGFIALTPLTVGAGTAVAVLLVVAGYGIRRRRRIESQ